MKKIIAISFITIGILMSSVWASNEISTCFSNNKIYLNEILISDKIENPLIMYNDLTYMSIRDIGKIFDKKIQWNEKESIVIMNDNIDIKKPFINKIETAMIIGKAIIKEHFDERINESTKYSVMLLVADQIDAQPLYEVSVWFDAPDGINDDVLISNNADCKIYINSITGEIDMT